MLASGVLSLPIIGGDLARDDRKFFEYASTVLRERAAAEENGSGAQKDIMHHLLNAEDPMTGKAFSQEQLGVESSLLIAAGADTTSLTLAAVLFYLVRNTRVMRILQDEIQSAFPAGSADLTTPSQLIALPYLRAVIDETLRLAPPVPSLLPREVLKGGLTINGTFIPEGTIVGVPAYAIHRTPEYFPDPEEFIPERWLTTDSESNVSNDRTQSSSSPSPDLPRTRHPVSLARQAFIPFSQGSRGCIGRQLAYYELHTALAHLLYRFEIRLARDPETEELVEDTTGWKTGSVDVVGSKDVEGGKRAERRERQKRDEFQLFDAFLADRNGPMVEFRERDTGC